MVLRLKKVGRTQATNYELLTKAILSHWKSPEIDLSNILLSKQNEDKSESERGFQYYY